MGRSDGGETIHGGTRCRPEGTVVLARLPAPVGHRRLRQRHALVRGVGRRTVHIGHDRFRARRRSGISRAHDADAVARRVRRRDGRGRGPQACPRDRSVHYLRHVGDSGHPRHVRSRATMARRRRGIDRGHRLVHRDVHPPPHGGRERTTRTGAAGLGPGYADQLDHPHGRPHRRRHALPVRRPRGRLHGVITDVSTGSSSCGRAALPAAGTPVHPERCAARSRRGHRLRPRPRGDRRCPAGHHRDEPARLPLFRVDRADWAAALHGFAGAGGDDGGSRNHSEPSSGAYGSPAAIHPAKAVR